MFENLIWKTYQRGVVPLLIFTMRILSRANPKIRLGLEMREGLPNGTKPWLNFPARQRPIWIHCASGEFEYAKPVITRLKQKSSSPILVTYFSPSIKKAVESYPGIDFSCPLPWDRPDDWSEFLNFHQPRVLMIARTDTWPEMLRQAKLHGVPSLLFAATLVRKSGRVTGLNRFLSQLVFRNLDAIYCVTAEDKEIFNELGCDDKTVIAGDTRYDQVLARLSQPKPLSPFVNTDAFLQIRVFVAGSTWPEDEKVIVPAIARFKGRLKTILVPHEPHLDHLRELERLVSANGLTFERYSKLSDQWQTDVLIVDQMGILAELYQLGDIAFVGGSFRKTVHSVMEPLAAGCVTLLGPLHTNNREAMSFQKLSTSTGLTTVVVAHDSADFASKLSLLIGLGSEQVSKIKSEIREEIQLRSRKSELVVSWALDHLK